VLTPVFEPILASTILKIVVGTLRELSIRENNGDFILG